MANSKSFEPLEAEVELQKKPIASPEVQAAIDRTTLTGVTRPQQSVPQPVKYRRNNKDKQGASAHYIPWGPDNLLPRQIAVLTDALPYTAQAIGWLTDMLCGLGPKLMYHTAEYRNGRMQEVTFPYEHGGAYLMGRIAETDDETEKARLTADFAKWERTYYGEVVKNERGEEVRRYGVKRFLEDNDMTDLWRKWASDITYFDVAFPTIGLSIDRHWKKGGNDAAQEWQPRITHLGHIPAVCGRYEQMDENLRINNVFYAEKWRNDSTAELQLQDAVAYPTLMPQNFLAKLRARVRSQAMVDTQDRNYWYCAPLQVSDAVSPYYPQPHWWSVFESKLYQNTLTLFADRAAARENSTMWGKLLVMNCEYLRSVYASLGIDSPQEQKEIKQEIFDSVNNFLKRRENNGKTMAIDSILSPDGKTMMKAVEIIDIPANKVADVDLEKDLGPLCSSIFFAMGVHPALIGAVPGESKSSSGTYQRELTLLKQNQLSPRQRMMLRLLQNVCVFNGWDEHATWIVRQQVLTTLDRNPEGTEESEVTQ